jgi:hypothetical protein
MDPNTILYELWYSIAESLFQKVCEVTDLTEEQQDALRAVALRPNDFQVHIEP